MQTAKWFPDEAGAPGLPAQALIEAKNEILALHNTCKIKEQEIAGLRNAVHQREQSLGGLLDQYNVLKEQSNNLKDENLQMKQSSSSPSNSVCDSSTITDGTTFTDSSTCTDVPELDDVSIAELNAVRMENKFLRDKQQVLNMMQTKLEENSRQKPSAPDTGTSEQKLLTREQFYNQEMQAVEEILDKRREEVDLLKQIIRSQEDELKSSLQEKKAFRKQLDDMKQTSSLEEHNPSTSSADNIFVKVSKLDDFVKSLSTSPYENTSETLNGSNIHQKIDEIMCNLQNVLKEKSPVESADADKSKSISEECQPSNMVHLYRRLQGDQSAAPETWPADDVISSHIEQAFHTQTNQIKDLTENFMKVCQQMNHLQEECEKYKSLQTNLPQSKESCMLDTEPDSCDIICALEFALEQLKVENEQLKDDLYKYQLPLENTPISDIKPTEMVSNVKELTCKTEASDTSLSEDATTVDISSKDSMSNMEESSVEDCESENSSSVDEQSGRSSSVVPRKRIKYTEQEVDIDTNLVVSKTGCEHCKYIMDSLDQLQDNSEDIPLSLYGKSLVLSVKEDAAVLELQMLKCKKLPETEDVEVDCDNAVISTSNERTNSEESSSELNHSKVETAETDDLINTSHQAFDPDNSLSISKFKGVDAAGISMYTDASSESFDTLKSGSVESEGKVIVETKEVSTYTDGLCDLSSQQSDVNLVTPAHNKLDTSEASTFTDGLKEHSDTHNTLLTSESGVLSTPNVSIYADASSESFEFCKEDSTLVNNRRVDVSTFTEDENDWQLEREFLVKTIEELKGQVKELSNVKKDISENIIKNEQKQSTVIHPDEKHLAFSQTTMTMEQPLQTAFNSTQTDACPENVHEVEQSTIDMSDIPKLSDIERSHYKQMIKELQDQIALLASGEDCELPESIFNRDLLEELDGKLTSTQHKSKDHGASELQQNLINNDASVPSFAKKADTYDDKLEELKVLSTDLLNSEENNMHIIADHGESENIKEGSLDTNLVKVDTESVMADVEDTWSIEKSKLEERIQHLELKLQENNLSERSHDLLEQSSIDVQTEAEQDDDNHQLALSVLADEWLSEKESLSSTINELTDKLSAHEQSLCENKKECCDISVQTESSEADRPAEPIEQTEYESVGVASDESLNLSRQLSSTHSETNLPGVFSAHMLAPENTDSTMNELNRQFTSAKQLTNDEEIGEILVNLESRSLKLCEEYDELRSTMDHLTTYTQQLESDRDQNESELSELKAEHSILVKKYQQYKQSISAEIQEHDRKGKI